MITNIEHFGPLSSTYNNILALCATGIKNSHQGGFEDRGYGIPHCVTLTGKTYHHFVRAKNFSEPSGKILYI